MAAITRRDFAKLAGAGAATLSLGGLLSACSSGSETQGTAGDAGSAEGSNQVIVSMTVGSEPAAGFDPLVSWGCGEHVHEPLIQSTLITTDADLNFVNDLATSYEASEDGMTWTFKIRDDARFSDGTPLTARDVAFTINGILNAEASECDMSMVKEAVADDDATVVVHIRLDDHRIRAVQRVSSTLAVIQSTLGIVPRTTSHAYDEACWTFGPRRRSSPTAPARARGLHHQRI